MSFEIDDDSYPATSVVFIEASWGSITATGSGVLVGRNDVLTASHVVYNQNWGGFADEVLIYPSYDPDATDNVAFSYRYGQYFPDFDPDGDGRLFPGDFQSGTLGQSEIDIALLATSEPIGETYGWMGIDWSYGGGNVGVLGHPGLYGRQPMFDSGNISRYGTDNVWNIQDLEVNPGNSGGPIYYDYGDGPRVVGVVSTGLAAANVGAHANWLNDALTANDSFLDDGDTADDDQLPPWYSTGSADLLGGAGDDPISGTSGDNIIFGFAGADTLDGRNGNDVLVGGPDNDRLIGHNGNDTLIGGAGYDTLQGGGGTDTAVYWFDRADYGVRQAGPDWQVVFADGQSENLIGVERILFQDGTLALDTDGHAGEAYRLYQAVFGRSADATGLRFWTERLDDGLSLEAAAGGFIDSGEFAARFGSDLGNGAFVDTLYLNVLGRFGEIGGWSYWTDALDDGMARAEVLVAFSESSENRAGVADEIESGIWLA